MMQRVKVIKPMIIIKQLISVFPHIPNQRYDCVRSEVGSAVINSSNPELTT